MHAARQALTAARATSRDVTSALPLEKTHINPFPCRGHWSGFSVARPPSVGHGAGPPSPAGRSPHAAACSPPFERREDPRRDGGWAPAVDEVEQVMEVDVSVCCERVRQRRIAAGLTQDITAPSQDVSGDIARCRLPSDVGFHVSSRGCRVVWCSRLSWRAFRAASYLPERDEPPEVRTRAPATQTR